MRKFVYYLLCLYTFLSGCEGVTYIDLPTTEEETFLVTLHGRVVLPEGEKGVYGATVTVQGDSLSEEISVITDIDGKFSISDIPLGSHYLDIRKGRFSAIVTLQITDEVETLNIGDIPLNSQEVHFAIITGSYDRVEDIIYEMGFTNFDSYDGSTDEVTSFLLSPNLLDTYDIIIINDGIDEDRILNEEEAISNLLSFVEMGGGVYISNRNYEILDTLFDDSVFFLNEGSGSAEKGVLGNYLADIYDSELLTVLSPLSNVTIQYDSNGWAIPIGVTGEAEVILMGKDVEYSDDGGAPSILETAPLTLSIPYGEGSILFNTYDFVGTVNYDMKEIGYYLILRL